MMVYQYENMKIEKCTKEEGEVDPILINVKWGIIIWKNNAHNFS
jgi:hypothetical protein